MRGLLSFRLPEEEQEFLDAQNGSKYKHAMQELDNWLRGKIKHSAEDESKLQECRDRLHEILDGLPIY